MSDDLVQRLRKRAEIRRQISTRKSVQEGKADRLADLLDEAAEALDRVTAERDAALARAEKAERERDEARAERRREERLGAMQRDTLRAQVAQLREALRELVERRERVGSIHSQVYGDEERGRDGGDGRYARARVALRATEPKEGGT